MGFDWILLGLGVFLDIFSYTASYRERAAVPTGIRFPSQSIHISRAAGRAPVLRCWRRLFLERPELSRVAARGSAGTTVSRHPVYQNQHEAGKQVGQREKT